MFQPGTIVGKKYLVQSLLAEGGMGEVYLASVQGPAGFKKDVVIKCIKSSASSDPEFVQMFIGEAQLASRFTHQNLVQIFDFDQQDGIYYLAMEYVPGHSLKEIREKCKERMQPFPVLLAAHVGAEIARGLHYAHSKTENGIVLGLVHRDCTPHNILLSYSGAVKLADFGVAKSNDKRTASGILKGKFAYMSPEQARGEKVDGRTDIFALGIVLWELLTGSRLFVSDSDVGTLKAVQESLISPPVRLNPNVPEPLSNIVLKALERDVNARYQTAHELEWALTQFLRQHAQLAEDTDVASFLNRIFPSADQPEPAQVVTPSMIAAPTQNSVVKTYVLANAPTAKKDTVLYRAEDYAKPPPKKSKWMAVSGLGVVLAAAAGVVGFIHWRPRHASMPPVVVLPPPSPSVLSDPAPAPVSAPAPATSPSDIVYTSPPENTHSRHPRSDTRKMGDLIVHIQPWAKVYIDDKDKGLFGGTRSFKLSAGSHRIRFEHANRFQEKRVTILEGKSTEETYHATDG